MRQQIALLHEATRNLYRERLAWKEALWLDESATGKQLETLGRYRKHLPGQALAAGCTKREAAAITYYRQRKVLLRAPDL